MYISIHSTLTRSPVIQYFEPRGILNPGQKYRCDILTLPHNTLNPGSKCYGCDVSNPLPISNTLWIGGFTILWS